jgi:hypothetical protein
MNRSPRPENRRTAGLRALRSESKWRDGGRGQRQRASARLRRLSHLQLARSDALCSMGTSTFLVALPRPKEFGLSRSCPLPVPRRECDRQTQCPHQQQFSRGEVPRFLRVGCPLEGLERGLSSNAAIFGRHFRPINPLIYFIFMKLASRLHFLAVED